MSIASDRDTFCQKATPASSRLVPECAMSPIERDLLNRAQAIVIEALGLTEDAADVFIKARALSAGKSVTQVANSIIHVWQIYR